MMEKYPYYSDSSPPARRLSSDPPGEQSCSPTRHWPRIGDLLRQPNRWAWPIGILLAMLVGASLRWVDLGNRPMHADEAVQAIRFARLLEEGQYRYDPEEYHGPALPYGTLPIVQLLGVRLGKDLEAWHLRLLPACVGVVLVWGAGWVRRSLGGPATLVAAWLTAVSPALVFYSRYYIAEMLLVGFSWGAIVAWWAVRTRLQESSDRPDSMKRLMVPSVLLGLCLGLMYATKETWVIPLVSMAAAAGLTMPRLDGKAKRRLLAALGLVLAVGTVVWAGLFSSFGQNPTGLLDSVRTYLHYVRQAGGQGRANEHIYPFWYYFQVLFAWKRPGGSWWTEAWVLALALVGGLAAVAGRWSRLKAEQAALGRFLVIYTFLQVFIYSAIPYKTPWCALGFYSGMVVLAGLGGAVLWQWAARPRHTMPMIRQVVQEEWPDGSPSTGRTLSTGKSPAMSAAPPVRPSDGLASMPSLLKKAVVFFGLLLAGGHLLWQAYRASFLLVADPTQPYLYAPTTHEVAQLVETVEKLAGCHPDGHALPIQVFFPDHQYWPLPWYLRRFSRVGWFGSLEEAEHSAPAPVLLVHPDMESGLLEYCYFRQPPGQRRLYLQGMGQGPVEWQIRPHVPIRLYVRWDLWEACGEKSSGPTP